MADETLDLGHLYDGVDLDELGGGHLYDDTELEPRITDDLLHRDMIVVQPMKPVETVYGSGTVPDGDAPTVTARSSLESIRTARFPRTGRRTPRRKRPVACVRMRWRSFSRRNGMGTSTRSSGSITPVTRLTARLWRCVTPRMPPTIGTSPRGASAMRPRTTG